MNPSRPARRRPRGNRPRFEAAMQRQSLVPLTVDFYNRLQFAGEYRRLGHTVGNDAASVDAISQWQRVFPGRES